MREAKALTFIDAALGNRKAFSNAAAEGLAVSELSPPDPKASEEMAQLVRYCFDTNVKSAPKGH